MYMYILITRNYISFERRKKIDWWIFRTSNAHKICFLINKKKLLLIIYIMFYNINLYKYNYYNILVDFYLFTIFFQSIGFVDFLRLFLISLFLMFLSDSYFYYNSFVYLSYSMSIYFNMSEALLCRLSAFSSSISLFWIF